MTNQRLMVAPHSPLSIDDAKKAMRTRAFAARAGHDPVACGNALATPVLRDMPAFVRVDFKAIGVGGGGGG